jgi:hypothetical protein
MPVSMRTWLRASGIAADADETQHRAEFLRKAGEIEHAGPLALQMRRHGGDRADGDHAGAANAGDQQVERLLSSAGSAGFGTECISFCDVASAGFGLRRSAPSTVTKLGQKPLRQDMSLLQLDWLICRLRPNSVSLGSMLRQLDSVEQSPQPSQTSSLMNGECLRIGHSAALAPPALFGRAGLLVDQHRDAGNLAQFALHRVHLSACVNGDAARKICARELLGIIGHQRDPLDALGAADMGNRLNADRTIDRLTAGHGDRVVVEDLVGDVGLAAIACRIAIEPE